MLKYKWLSYSGKTILLKLKRLADICIVEPMSMD